MTDPWVGHFRGNLSSHQDQPLADTDRRAFFYWNFVPIEGDFGTISKIEDLRPEVGFVLRCSAFG